MNIASDTDMLNQGWTFQNTTYFDISSSTGGANARCYRKAPDLCGQTCSQRVSSGQATCDVTTWADMCGSQNIPAPFDATWTVEALCPRECGTATPPMDICGHDC